MFIGINYALYTFVIIPKELEVQSARDSYTMSGQNQNIYQALKAENDAITSEIQELSTIRETFDFYVSQDLDTIQLTYDFYTFAKNMAIEGVAVQYDIGSIATLEGFIEEEVVETESDIQVVDDLVVTKTNDTIAAEDVNETVGEEKLIEYIEVPITLVFLFDKYKLNDVLEYLDVITNQKIYKRLLEFEVRSEDLSIDEEIVKEDYIQLTIDYDLYIDIESDLTDTNLAYAFYNENVGYEDIADLFASQLEEDIITD